MFARQVWYPLEAQDSVGFACGFQQFCRRRKECSAAKIRLPENEIVKSLIIAGLRRLWAMGSLFTSKLSRPIWLFRFHLVSRSSPAEKVPLAIQSWGRIPVFYINLETRSDRREEVGRELRRVGLRNRSRFTAIPREQGLLGCALSHSALLSQLEEVSGPVIICEDDIQFTADQEALASVLQEFLKDDRLDVLCLANNYSTKPWPISPLLAIVNNTQTTSCYVVKERAKRPLMQIFSVSAGRLESGWDESIFAPDILWKKLQGGRLFFAVPRRQMAKQRASYSDIQRDWVDYGL